MFGQLRRITLKLIGSSRAIGESEVAPEGNPQSFDWNQFALKCLADIAGPAAKQTKPGVQQRAS
jgi:hypothetical protein